MKTIEPADQGMRVSFYMFMILFQYLPEKLVLGVSDCLDDKSIIPRKVEEGPGFAW